MFRRASFAAVLALLACVVPAQAQYFTAAAEPPPVPAQMPPAAAGPRHPAPYGYSVQPLDRILPAIRSGRPGRFFDAEGPFPDPAGGWHYRIKWLTPEGRVLWLDADARTGRVLGPYRGYAHMVYPPAGLHYYPFPGPRGPGRFGGWRPGGWRGGWGGWGGRRR
ncbi:MAG TPA: hypothetical protein VMF67_14380 [Rhizomicrobium sp.]|nr:hypothetical protein [Rhizomicrobium sp.]